jgi:thioredoxin
MNALNDEQILDVRTPEEFSQGHLAKAINIDWNDKDFSAKTVLVDKARPVMIYCQAGGRSAAAANKLREMGFTSVYELDGGMNAWNAANLPIEFPAIEKAKTTTSSLVIDKPTSKAVYLEEIKKDRYTLVDFTATWCGPCKIMAPRIDDLQQQMNGSFTVMKVDIDRDPEIADSMQVGSIPTLVMYKNGKQLWRHTGLLEKNSLEQMVKQEMK